MSENNAESCKSIAIKKKSSLGKQCAAFGCYSFSYHPDGTPTGLHFFRFPQNNPAKRLWCNLIKRVDGLDGFKIYLSCLCISWLLLIILFSIGQMCQGIEIRCMLWAFLAGQRKTPATTTL